MIRSTTPKFLVFVVILCLLSACVVPQLPVVNPTGATATPSSAPADTEIQEETDVSALESGSAGVEVITPRRVLFIGPDSFSTNPMDKPYLTELINVARPDLQFEADYRNQRNYVSPTLLAHANFSGTLELIASGGFDVVFLEEVVGYWKQSRPDFEETYLQTVETLAEHIRAAGAIPVLYLSIPGPLNQPDVYPIAYEAGIVTQAAEQIDAPVAPIGLAFVKALQERPDLVLTQGDWVHPTHSHGAYLMACVVYATLYGESPEGIDYVPWYHFKESFAKLEGTRNYQNMEEQYRITDDERDFLQRIAWETVKEWGRTVMPVRE